MKTEKQLTAVEWLINEHFGGIDNCTPDFRYHIEQAKKMEKEQIILAHGIKMKGVNNMKCVTGEQYYNETYKLEQ